MADFARIPSASVSVLREAPPRRAASASCKSRRSRNGIVHEQAARQRRESVARRHEGVGDCVGWSLAAHEHPLDDVPSLPMHDTRETFGKGAIGACAQCGQLVSGWGKAGAQKCNTDNRRCGDCACAACSNDAFSEILLGRPPLPAVT